jgi:hypothetical protein
LGTGHVTFFYNKSCFLIDRAKLLQEEAIRRGFESNCLATVIKSWEQAALEVIQISWQPDQQAFDISAERIKQRVSLKPLYYRMSKTNLDEQSYQEWIQSLENYKIKS